MNAVVEVETAAMVPARSANPTAEVVAHAQTVQKVMQAVMKPNVHYGAIPGAGDKPTLLKSGAEVLCMTFRIADRYEVTDLSAHGVIRYRVNCIGEHQGTGQTLGSGLGECSTDEEKYKWRKAVCPEEFDATPETHRRQKFGRKAGGHYTVQQIRTEPADLANTVLKMACKRAKIAMVLNVTAASDMFSQDLEDLDAELVRHLAEDEREGQINSVREDLFARARAAESRDELTRIWKEGQKTLSKMRDKEGYEQFAAVAKEVGAKFPKEDV